jgi:hypothetical protein
LIELSYKKIQLTQTIGNKFSENYFQALSLTDMSLIHDVFGELDLALEKIETAQSKQSDR